ncbi:MAG: PDZ domain-containing protein [Acidobacteria bacterium]|nr:MAG: PDZ domain-containing protein [Acidobacteriota bacterium]
MPRTWLGVELLSPSAGVRRALGGPADAGVLVNEVAEDSPAAKAGLEAGDLIVAIDGAPVDTVRALRRILGKHEPGDTVTVEIVRRGDRRSVQVTLGESKSRVFMFRQHGEGPVIAIPPDLEIELPDLDELREHLRSLDDEQIEIDIDEIESRVREALERAREALERSREAQERHREQLERRPGAGGGRVIDAMVGPGSGFAHPTTLAI